MALDSVPWFIGGGAEHSPAVARMLAYAATSGATGVISPSDLRVTALPTPGAAVRIMPGGAAILNRYPGAANQSYTARNASATDVAVPATGSSGGATRYLILRVDDPEFGGQAPTNVVDGPYVRAVLVSSITNLAYPFVPLAKITQPANTATITQAMIADIRDIANPREKQVIIPRPLQGSDVPAAGFDQLNGATSDGQPYPFYAQGANQSGNTLLIPEWATRMQIEATWIAVRMQPANTDGFGDYWVDFGPVVRPEKLKYSTRVYHWDQVAGDFSRNNWELADEVAIPEELRGQNVSFLMKASRQGAAYPRMDGRSGYKLKVRFLERADSGVA
ncbi:hypothetical protein KKR91_01115 [Arthrobacter jiangjiafuii]|uniref:Uncharacterized protein n=1 Tax=Arthrobacter jiangjiafuii TaxID=2817475 RepID=A0A975M614_9MICC|nr:hypothetical protein [Arthrobacter jiangjiafuii]MBP3044893.1 hypothetical protein [Arthrobacter jiangjiafuii]QWC10284.1 hypothetical protein KKR91_01115 [Arthrobacter jiangjiafuii]